MILKLALVVFVVSVTHAGLTREGKSGFGATFTTRFLTSIFIPAIFFSQDRFLDQSSRQVSP